MNLNDLDLEPVTAPEQTRAPGMKSGTRDTFFDDPPAPVAEAAPTTPAPAVTPKPFTPKPETTSSLTAAVPVSPVVQKMRAILGLTEEAITRVPLYVGDNPEPAFTFGLRPLAMDDFEWIAAQILADAIANGEEVSAVPTPKQQMIWDYYIIACSIASIDDGVLLPEAHPTPVWQALGVPIPATAYVRNPYFPHAIVRHACAEILFPELRTEFYAFTQFLIKTYRDIVEPKSRVSMTPATKEAPANPTTPEP